MGCLASSRRVPDEEKDLLRGERLLGFCSHSSEAIETTLKRWSVPSGLTPARLSKALQSLQAPSAEDPGNLTKTQVVRLYKHFLLGEKYDAQKLLIFAVLLSAGPLTKKLEVWFDNIDVDLSGSITKDQFRRFLLVLIEANSTLLPEFVAENSDKMQQYVKEWRTISSEFCENVVTLVFSSHDRLQRAKFLSQMSDEFQKLTYCAGVRTLLQEFYIHYLAVHSSVA